MLMEMYEQPGPGRRFLAQQRSWGEGVGRARIAAGIPVSCAMRGAVQERIARGRVRPASLSHVAPAETM